jgi:prepilin-type N-terminal cleavage/methylation domain-containing protein
MDNCKKGFTLVELVVVMSIISLLSSIVLVNMNGYMAKARDAVVRAELDELSKLMIQNYSEYGSYCQIQPSVWVNSDGITYTCDYLFNNIFYGKYAQKARDLCNSIYKNASDPLYNNIPGGYKMLIYVYVAGSPDITCANSFSWSAYLSNGNWYCVGSSGVKGEYPAYGGSPGVGYQGCYSNP